MTKEIQFFDTLLSITGVLHKSQASFVKASKDSVLSAIKENYDEGPLFKANFKSMDKDLSPMSRFLDGNLVLLSPGHLREAMTAHDALKKLNPTLDVVGLVIANVSGSGINMDYFHLGYFDPEEPSYFVYVEALIDGQTPEARKVRNEELLLSRRKLTREEAERVFNEAISQVVSSSLKFSNLEQISNLVDHLRLSAGVDEHAVLTNEGSDSPFMKLINYAHTRPVPDIVLTGDLLKKARSLAWQASEQGVTIECEIDTKYGSEDVQRRTFHYDPKRPEADKSFAQIFNRIDKDLIRLSEVIFERYCLLGETSGDYIAQPETPEKKVSP